MNKIKKPSLPLRSPLISIPVILLVRAITLAVTALIVFNAEDPSSLIPLASSLAKVICEFVSGMVIAKAIGSGFTPATRITVSALASLVINTAELFVGKAISDGEGTSLLLFPIAVASCAVGAAVASRSKAKPKRKRNRKK